MKTRFYTLTLVAVILMFGFSTALCCPANPDKRYNRQEILEKFASVLNTSVPEYSQYHPRFSAKNEISTGFFVFDLTDTSNREVALDDCIDFIDGHVYHFWPFTIEYSKSHIAFLENGQVEVFKSVNCDNSKDNLTTVLAYLNEKLKHDKNREGTLTRVRNYRRYGFYIVHSDVRQPDCEERNKITPNPDPIYDRRSVLRDFEKVLYNFMPDKATEYDFLFPVQNDRAIGFFVYDLTDPSNKQTSLTERVNFMNNHIYHFAWIDLPYSYSHIAILEGEEDVKVFKAINCRGKGDSIHDVLRYLARKLKGHRNKAEILKRVKDYRRFGVYTPLNGVSVPQCKELCLGGTSRRSPVSSMKLMLMSSALRAGHLFYGCRWYLGSSF